MDKVGHTLCTPILLHYRSAINNKNDV